MERYREAQRDTDKYREVQRGIEKYREVQRDTKRHGVEQRDSKKLKYIRDKQDSNFSLFYVRSYLAGLTLLLGAMSANQS